jgi:mono/diheme cytochrome c family protein
MKPLRLVITLLLLIACITLELTRLIKKPFPPAQFDSMEMQFKYGSIGAEVNGYPFLIWRELPTIFRDRIPNGWKDFGFIFEGGREVPIGISIRRVGVPRVGFNCSTCHTSTVTQDGKSTLLLGAPAGQLDLQSYLFFLEKVSNDPALTADAVFKSAEDAGHPVDWFDKLLFRYYVFPRLGKEAAGLASGFVWMERRPAHGPGRTDAGNFWRSRWGLQPEKDDLVGTVDFPSVWNQRERLDGWFHWDGNNSSLSERNLSAALAGGAPEWLLSRRAIQKISDWLLDLKAPAFPGPVDAQLAEKGSRIYQRESCGNCHDKSSGQLGQVTPLSVVRTDPERNKLFSPTMVEYFQQVGSAYSWRFSHYRSTDGYANMPLDGIWARAPYLHNGSVPDLEALFTPEAERPRKFLRGCSDFDISRVGFRCTKGFEFDTQLRGNGNGGHPFGTALSPDEKSSLIEYLKTL